MDATVLPDGDAELDHLDLSGFATHCPSCGGVLKPVVFFGESVPQDQVSLAMEALEQAEAMLVVSSSLIV